MSTVIATAVAIPADAITGGISAPETAQAQSTVLISRGSAGSLTPSCTGTLVAADLVLTAGQCLDHWEVPTTSRPHPDFRGSLSNDWERPDRFYSTSLLPRGVPTVTVAADTVANEANEFHTTATDYAVPGDADVALLRLARPVPGNAAVPVPIMTAPPGAVADSSSWLANRAGQFQVAGYFNSTLQASNLQTATVTGVQSPCPNATAPKICEQVTNPVGASMQRGDSGGPLFLTDAAQVRRLAGVLQDTGPTHTATFYRGGSGTRANRTEVPNIGAWLEQFVTRRSGGAAFVQAEDPNPRLDGYASNPSGLRPIVTRITTGVYRVRFEGLGNTSQPRIPLVTSTSWSRYCKVGDGWAPDIVVVRCFDDAGSPANATFSLVSDYSNHRDLWVRAPLLTSGMATVRSVHGDVTVTHLGTTGSYRVESPGWTGGAWKSVIVTAEGPGPARCHVVAWSGSTATVRCSAGSTRRDSGFTFAATSDTDSSYAWGSQSASDGYTADPAYANTAGSGNLPTIQRLGTGRYRVSFTGLPANVGGNMQVTAYGDTFNRCNVEGYAPDWVGIGCLSPAGAYADERFVVRYIDPLDVGRTVQIGLNELIGTSSDTGGALDMLGQMRFTAGASGSVEIPLVRDRLNRRFSPPLVLAARSQPGQRFVDVEIRVRDDDGANDPTDRVDIVPNPNVTDLRFRVDLAAHTVTMLDSVRPILGGLGSWWSDGCPPSADASPPPCDVEGIETARAVFNASISDH